MLGRVSVLALSALADLAIAQAIQVPPLPFNLTFTPDLNRVSPDRRSDWCQGERGVCDTLCGVPDKYPTKNDCDPGTLQYACTCQNGTAPGLEFYHNSLPTFICEEAYDQCIAANVGNRDGQNKCTTDVKSKCGRLDAKDARVGGGSASTTAASATSSATQTSSNTQSSSSARPQNVAAPTRVPHYVGVAVAAAALGAYAL